jgi:superfamily II DNA or RNA helicase
MSQRFIRSDFTKEGLDDMKDKCFVKGNPSEYGPADTVQCWIQTKENIYLPFHYSREISKDNPNKKVKHSRVKYDLKVDFKNDMQREIYDETTHLLKKQKSAVISLYCGAGKCLGWNTAIRCYDGTIKPVQEIKVGDYLLGDDNTKRNVLSVCQGTEMMYNLIQSHGETYRVNESHILTVIIPKHKTIEIIQSGKEEEPQGIIWYWFDKKQYELKSERLYNNNVNNGIKIAEYELSKIETSDNIFDIPVKKYINMSEFTKSQCYVWRPPAVFEECTEEYELDGYYIGHYFMNGGIDTEGFYIELKNDHVKNLFHIVYGQGYRMHTQIEKRMSKYSLLTRYSMPNKIKTYSLTWRMQLLAGILDATAMTDGKTYYIPRKYSQMDTDILDITHSIGFDGILKKNMIEIYPTYVLQVINPQLRNVNINLYRNQYKVAIDKEDMYYGFTIDGNNRFRLGDYSVTHNTYTGIRLAQKSGMKTAVLIHRTVLANQWKESIERFTTARSQIVSTIDTLDEEADFYIMNIGYIFKEWNKKERIWKMKQLGIYRNIGVVIVDEAHVACATEMVKSLFFFEPRILIGLTATPNRKDGLDKVLDLYFGEERIIRISQSVFYVYPFKTFFTPTNVKNTQGRKDWSKVIDSIAEDVYRNQKIIQLVKLFETETIMILTKLTKHVNVLVKMLKENGESVTKMCGTDKQYNTSARVLISTFSKLGVGFDDTRFNCLILACDVEQVEQYAGRLREGSRDRIIIDMIDEDNNCKAHYRCRKRWYESRNGKIIPFEKRYPKFFQKEIKEDNQNTEYKRLANRNNNI